MDRRLLVSLVLVIGWLGALCANAHAAGYKQLSASSGWAETCAVRSDDGIVCWGFGQTNGAAFKQVAEGGYHTCAIRADDTLTCWGDNGSGRTNPPAGTYKSVSAGAFHTCAIRTDDVLTCWGLDEDGETHVPAGTYKQVSAGDFFTCAIESDDTVACWGSNGVGQAERAGRCVQGRQRRREPGVRHPARRRHGVLGYGLHRQRARGQLQGRDGRRLLRVRDQG